TWRVLWSDGRQLVGARTRVTLGRLTLDRIIHHLSCAAQCHGEYRGRNRICILLEPPVIHQLHVADVVTSDIYAGLALPCLSMVRTTRYRRAGSDESRLLVGGAGRPHSDIVLR